MLKTSSRSTLNSLSSRLALLAVLGLGLAACGAPDEEVADETGTGISEAPPPPPASETAGQAGGGAQGASTAAARECAPDPNIDYLCGPRNAEDLVRVGDSRWVLASGMDGQISGGDFSGRIHLIDSDARTWEVLFPGDDPQFSQDQQLFGNCPGELDTNNFSAHGLAISELEGQADRYRVYVTSHGAREAIEAFELDASGDRPSLTWTGCVLLPDTTWSNSVAILPDGGFFATQFIPAGETLDPVLAGEITGHVYEWHPGGEVTVLEGSELSGANGIAYDEDNNDLWVAAYGTEEVVRFDLDAMPPSKDSVDVGIHVDNLRWSPDGTLYAAGGEVGDCGAQGCGWAVIEVDPQAMSANRVTGADGSATMQGISVGLPVDDEIWVGTYAGDRVGILPAP